MLKRVVQRIREVGGPILKFRKYFRIMEEELASQLPYPPSKEQIRWCYWDFLWFRAKYKGSFHDYFESQMYRKSGFSRKESLSRYIRFPWRDALQQKKDWMVFQDKREFYKAFSGDLHREWMIVGQTSSWDEYIEFLTKCSYQVFAKLPMAGGGKGVYFLILDNAEKQRDFFLVCQKEEHILEGKLEQCDEIFSFSGSSVNTFRIITLVDSTGKVHVAAAVLRMGKGGSHLDNFCMGGISAIIDVGTGIICSTAKDGNGKEYLHHPVTGKQIIGYQIPDWDGYKRFAVELAGKYPGMRYVGWDIIKDIHGNYCVIEGNKDAGVDLYECHIMWGLKPYYEAILNGRNWRA